MIQTLSYKILTDTCFWIGLIDKDDQYHDESVKVYDQINKFEIILPWPIYYEVLRTRFMRRPLYVDLFFRELKRPNIKTIDDSPYKQKALDETLKLAGKRQISLVDMVMRFMLDDAGMKIDYLVTFNESDFVDICRKRQISLYNKAG